MFKKIILIAISSMIVGCAANGTKSNSDGLNNYNIVENQLIQVGEKQLPFIIFKKQFQEIVHKKGRRFKETRNDFGSGVQWNEDYVVTAKHVSFADNSAYKCQEGCDIQFVKRKANDSIPVWRDLVAGEVVTFIGIDQTSKIQVISGHDLNIQTHTSSNSTVFANLALTQTFGGMSGGPAYAYDGKVVGMLTGGSNLEDGQPVTVYLSYEVVKAAWDKFQRTQLAAK